MNWKNIEKRKRASRISDFSSSSSFPSTNINTVPIGTGHTSAKAKKNHEDENEFKTKHKSTHTHTHTQMKMVGWIDSMCQKITESIIIIIEKKLFDQQILKKLMTTKFPLGNANPLISPFQ